MNAITSSLWSMAMPIIALIIPLTMGAMLIWLERRLLAVWQDRLGPNRVGPFGLLQVVADAIKMFFKEDWIPPFADRQIFVVAPAIIITTILLGFGLVPWTENFNPNPLSPYSVSKYAGELYCRMKMKMTTASSTLI